MDIAWLLCLWVIQGAIASYLAKRKGRNPYIWFGIGCFFGIFGILAIIIMKPVLRPQIPAAPQMRVSCLPHFLWYYLDDKSVQHGPMSSSALESALREGKVVSSTYVWREEMREWERFDKVCKDLGVPSDSLFAAN